MGKALGAAAVLLVMVALGLGGCAGLVTDVTTTGGLAVGMVDARGGGPAVPAAWEGLDQGAATTCPGLAWSVLGAIGRVESDSGRSAAPGVHRGANSAGAEGPMQFEPATFAAYATVGPGGAVPPNPYDPVDAVYTAARMLCADGAGRRGGVAGAVWDYNHATVYVDTVLALGSALDADPTMGSVPAVAIAFVAGQLGAPYRWGGTGAGGWDCSGLVQAAYRSAGVALPRVAQDQFDAGPADPAGTSVEPGDLVFFGASTALVDHVGLYIGGGEMIDAPHTGAVVRVEAAGWPDLVGATRPA